MIGESVCWSKTLAGQLGFYGGIVLTFSVFGLRKKCLILVKGELETVRLFLFLPPVHDILLISLHISMLNQKWLDNA